jgi:hypothetical protein
LGIVVDGIQRAGRVLEAKTSAQIAAGGEILGLAGDAAIFKAIRYSLPAAAVNADTAAGERRAALGGDVDDRRGAQAIGIFIVKLSARGSPGDEGTGVSCLLSGAVGFTISGCLAVGNRWEHLVKVAGLTMLAYFALAQVFLLDSSWQRYVKSVLAAFLMMGLGGALSYLFKRR